MARLEVGDLAPDFEVDLVDGSHLSLTEALAKSENGVVIYFYPRANTPGCTTEACDFNDSLARLSARGFLVLGISPDTPASLKKFQDNYDLGFLLGSDPDHQVLLSFGAWGEKNNYGRKTVGVIRSTFVISPDQKLSYVAYNVRAKGHVARVLKDLGFSD